MRGIFKNFKSQSASSESFTPTEQPIKLGGEQTIWKKNEIMATIYCALLGLCGV
jgi:hypothetical protein